MGITRIPAFVVARNISPLVFLQTNMFVIAGLRRNNSLRFFAGIILAVLIARMGALISQVMPPSLTVTLTVTAHIGVIADTS